MIVNSRLGFPLRLVPELIYCGRHPQRLVAVLWSRNLTTPTDPVTAPPSSPQPNHTPS